MHWTRTFSFMKLALVVFLIIPSSTQDANKNSKFFAQYLSIHWHPYRSPLQPGGLASSTSVQSLHIMCALTNRIIPIQRRRTSRRQWSKIKENCETEPLSVFKAVVGDAEGGALDWPNCSAYHLKTSNWILMARVGVFIRMNYRDNRQIGRIWSWTGEGFRFRRSLHMNLIIMVTTFARLRESLCR